MAIAPGTRLGPYEIQSSLGAGGMGEVYKARDTRLDRSVAIKIVLPEFAADPKRRERFDREARAVSRLTHPHIGAIYDVGEQHGVHFLVMEYVEGETLASRLTRAMPPDEALSIAIQIGEALDFAHRHGIVHRDIKPANIMLTKAGPTGLSASQVKLLDFGLAKLRDDSDAAGEMATRTVVSDDRTILGTLPYMAPEQLDGKTDARSDIFAFGAVLYEMLAGRRAFEGQTQSAIMAALMACNPPPLSSLQPLTPPAVERVVRKALARDPDARWQSARDLTDELRWIATGEQGSGAPAGRRPRLAHAGWIAAAVLVGAAAVVVALVFTRAGTAPAPMSHLTMPLEAGADFFAGGVASVALSPDGTTAAYAAARTDGTRAFYLRRLDQAEAGAQRVIPNVVSPFFSPDGTWAGFFAGGHVMKMPVSGGTPQEVCAASGGGRAEWTPEGMILFGELLDAANRGILQCSAEGGPVREVTKLDLAAGHTHHAAPQVLPGGQAVLFTVRAASPTGPKYQLAVQPLSGGSLRIILDDAAWGRYLGDGVLVYQKGPSLFATRFDVERLEVGGAGVVVLDNVGQETSRPSWAFAAGTLVYRPAAEELRTLVWVSAGGKVEPVSGAPTRNYFFPKLSHQGDRVALTIRDGARQDVYIYDLRHERLEQLTNDGLSWNGAWTPDDTRIAVIRRTGSQASVNLQRVDGIGEPELVTRDGHTPFVDTITREGKLVYGDADPALRSSYDLLVIDLKGDRHPQPFLNTTALEAGGRLDGTEHWISYAWSEAGRNEVRVTAFPSGGARKTVSSKGREGVWSRHGLDLFYRDGDQMLVVGIKPGEAFEFEKPRVVFEGRYTQIGGPGNIQYDVAPDGRFLMMKDVDRGLPHYDVIQGWGAHLAQVVNASTARR